MFYARAAGKRCCLLLLCANDGAHGFSRAKMPSVVKLMKSDCECRILLGWMRTSVSDVQRPICFVDGASPLRFD